MSETMQGQSTKEQLEEMVDDLRSCHVEFYADGDTYTDYTDMARNLIDKGWHKQTEQPIKETMSEPCYMCDNARLNDDLDDDTDFGSFTVGKSGKGSRIMIITGWGKPLRITSEKWNETVKRWVTVGIYYPKYCPNCGRKIVEYDTEVKS